MGQFRTIPAVYFLCALAFLADPAAHAGGPWFVAPSPAGNDSNDCLSAGSPCATIQAAIDRAGPGDTVNAAAGTYSESLSITKDLSLDGAGTADTIVDAADADRGLLCSASVEVSGLTLRNGKTGAGPDNSGAGISNSGTLTLTQVAVSANESSFLGGGIFNTGMLTLTESSVSSNLATNGGGGIENTGTLIVLRSTISGNETAFFGGGIDNDGGTVTIVDSTVSGNESSNFLGGGIANRGTLAIASSTITLNQGSSGPGIYMDTGSTARLRNTIVAGNTGTGAPVPNCGGFADITTEGHNLAGDSSCDLVANQGDQISADPILEALADNGGPTLTHALPADSPAVNAGNPAGCSDPGGVTLATDQRGVSRALGEACDIGAFEFEGPFNTPTPTPTITPTPTVTSTATPTVTPPAVPNPSDLSVESGDATQITLVWSQNADQTFDRYELYRGPPSAVLGQGPSGTSGILPVALVSLAALLLVRRGRLRTTVVVLIGLAAMSAPRPAATLARGGQCAILDGFQMLGSFDAASMTRHKDMTVSSGERYEYVLRTFDTDGDCRDSNRVRATAGDPGLPVPTPTPTPFVGPNPGQWTGTTSRSHDMSFDVSNDGTQWSNFQLATDFFVSTACGSATVNRTYTLPGPGDITGNSFSSPGGSFSFNGTFGSATTASGTYQVQNDTVILTSPGPPFTCVTNVNQTGTWDAATP